MVVAAVAAGGAWIWVRPRLLAGTLVSVEPEYRLRLHDGQEVKIVHGRAGQVSLPAGAYLLQGWTARRQDGRGRAWEIDRADGEPSRRVEVRARRTTPLPLASPIETELVVEQTPRDVLFRLRLKGAGGETCGAVRVDGRPAPLPRLRLEDAAGRVVARLRFADTCGAGCVQMWRPPRGLSQPLLAVPEINLGPFPLAAAQFRFRLTQTRGAA